MERLGLVGLGLVVAVAAWGQGGRNAAGRGAPGGAAPAAQTGGRAGRGAEAGTAAPGGGTLDFYNYDPTATAGEAIGDRQPAESHQKITVNGQALTYTARAGYLGLRNATTGQTEAHVFYTFYAKDGESAGRPLMFFFGGAPGVAAAWQEFGGLGPKRMEGAAWAENPHTLLGAADLVFVNPVGTGFSRPDRPDRATSFWNTAADTASMGEFVRGFLGHYDRQMSPVYLAGEDRGTGRVAGLAGYLNDHDVPVRGLVLLSVTESADALAGDAQYMTLLPSLILSAWHHKKLAPELNAMSSEQVAGEARKFASREYLHALYKGDRMTAEERTKAIADLSRLTGVGKQFLISNDLRVTLDRFNGELLREQHRALSPSDARVTGFVPPAAPGGRGGGGGFGFGAPASPIDFNLSSLGAGFLTAYEAYLRKELTFTGAANAIYYLNSGGVGTFTSTGNDDAALAVAFARNPNLRLFVTVNYFDLNAPFYATEYTLAHLNVAPEVRSHNITVTHLEAGGMPYLDGKALAKLHSDLASFVSGGTK
jgi:carboxypeptidase C (cathepsin A)